MNTIEWLNSLEWDYGFDRFSSHNSYKYEAQMMRLESYLPTYVIRDLAEAIDKKYVEKAERNLLIIELKEAEKIVRETLDIIDKIDLGTDDLA